MTEERKLVTVLFADIVGSTAIGASHDPEVVRRTLSRAFAEAQEHRDRTGVRQHLSMLLGWLGANAAMRGSFVEATRYAALANERAIASGSSLQRAIALRGAVWAAMWTGDLGA